MRRLLLDILLHIPGRPTGPTAMRGMQIQARVSGVALQDRREDQLCVPPVEVEAALKPIVSPNDANATLGKMITALRDKPAKWRFVLRPGDQEAAILDVVALARQVWKGDRARHGDSEEPPPTLAEARAAFFAAATLVHWCRSEALTVNS